jgi:lipid II:glycine glycyltransferase (peptidoglycan interpeptide bridge formation enzyme)
MSNILAGLFEHHSDYKKLEDDLENSGFQNSDYIIYLNSENHSTQYLASVAVKDDSQADIARSVFTKNEVLKTYLFENMSIEQANYDTVKKYIDARNRAEIHNSPDIKIRTASDGMNSEVKF